MNEMNSPANGGWNELRPMIDEALDELGEADREAIVLRYFRGL
jgi:DNA-directed RNA polymerase specialized sigma24 family protein